MRRTIYQDLLGWKRAKARKPLILKGARQVGKTYSLKEFGAVEFAHCHHFDFIKDKKLKTVFEGDTDPLAIIKKLEIQYDKKIDPARDLIIFDEIQDCPNALTSLKYFCDDLKNSFVIGSGSFLGVSLSAEPYPVGKIKTLKMYPMTFFEFLRGLGREPLLNAILEGTQGNRIDLSVHEKALEYLKFYFITGGLPEIVNEFKNSHSDLAGSFIKVREMQFEMLDNYQNDMSKHAGKINALKIQAVFQDVPVQLARENKNTTKFVFKDVLTSRSNYEQLEDPIMWLEKSGLIFKVPVCNRAAQPLKAYTTHNHFKLYLFDVGLLGAMTGLEPKTIFNYDFGSYKGYFVENYVLQELTSSLEAPVYSWKENTSEVEFLIALSGEITPVEVKAGINKKAKSLKVFMDKYSPKKSFLVSGHTISLKNKGVSYLPLYAVSAIG
ncbi:MAG: ATP-binding protein [Deltaproteobacteria bacterium]|nr:ATP-binding protein [Deltaproteobacteria bacterium]